MPKPLRTFGALFTIIYIRIGNHEATPEQALWFPPFFHAHTNTKYLKLNQYKYHKAFE
jgi:hypothetical protein